MSWLKIPFTLSFDDLRGSKPKTNKSLEHVEKKQKIAEHLERKQPGKRGQHQAEVTASHLTEAGQPTQVRSIEQMAGDVVEDWPDGTESFTVGFLKDTQGLYLEGLTFRAHLKDCAEVITKEVERDFGLKQFKHKLTNRLYVKEKKLYILRLSDSSHVVAADEICSHTMRVRTPMGERSCLKNVEQVNDCKVGGTILLWDDGVIQQKHFGPLIEYGQIHGMGQDRSMQYGRYQIELEWPG